MAEFGCEHTFVQTFQALRNPENCYAQIQVSVGEDLPFVLGSSRIRCARGTISTAMSFLKGWFGGSEPKPTDLQRPSQGVAC